MGGASAIGSKPITPASESFKEVAEHERQISKPIFVSGAAEIRYIGKAGVLVSPAKFEDSRLISPSVYENTSTGRIKFYVDKRFILGMDDIEVEVDVTKSRKEQVPKLDHLVLELLQSQKRGPEYTGDVLAFTNIELELHRLADTLKKACGKDTMGSFRVRLAGTASIVDATLISGTVVSVYSGMSRPGFPIVMIRITTGSEDRLYYIPALLEGLTKENGFKMIGDLTDKITASTQKFIDHIASSRSTAAEQAESSIIRVSGPASTVVTGTQLQINKGLAEAQASVGNSTKY